MSKILLSALRSMGRTSLVTEAETLVQERNEALRAVYIKDQQLEAMRQRLHELAAERNSLRRAARSATVDG